MAERRGEVAKQKVLSAPCCMCCFCGLAVDDVFPLHRQRERGREKEREKQGNKAKEAEGEGERRRGLEGTIFRSR